MNSARILSLVPALALLQPAPLRSRQAPPAIDLTVSEADLKDLLRAVTAGTDLNLVFEPGADTRVRGVALKGTSLQEILDLVLPGLGLTATREGHNLFIRKRSTPFRFYHLDQLAGARSGSKSYQVNASGQAAQGAASPGSNSANSASSSAYTSTIQLDTSSNPWAEVESGLMLLVFGRTVEARNPPAPAKDPAPAAGRGFVADGKTLLIQPNSGLVAVEADDATQARVQAYLDEISRRAQRQVLLEARIVEVSLGSDSQMGVDWRGLLSSNGNPALSSFRPGVTLDPNVAANQGLAQIVAQSGRVQATLSALARDKRLTVLSAPRLTTLSNQKAILRVVTEMAYTLPSSQITPGTAAGGAIATVQVTPLIVPVGIVLDILPEIGDDGMITLSVNPSVSAVTATVPITESLSTGTLTGSLPVVSRRDLDAVVRIRSGETLVLAGLIQKQDSKDNRGVPWVRSIPIIGSLFSKEEKSQARTELAIFITPTLLDDAKASAERQATEQRLETSGAEVRPGPGRPEPGFAVP